MAFRLVQITAGCDPGDAITNEAEILRDYFNATGKNLSRKGGHLIRSSVIAAEHIAPDLPFPVLPIEKYSPQPKDIILWHYSIGMRQQNRILSWNNPKFLLYHNITPANFFRPYSLSITGRLLRAREELRNLAGRFDAFFADSSLNASELEFCGIPKAKTIPVLFPISKSEKYSVANGDIIHSEIAPNLEPGKYRSILSVGRIVPNKNHAEMLRIMCFLKMILPNVRLTIAGGFVPGLDSYVESLHKQIRYLNLSNEVEITGRLSDAELQALYRQADLFISTSQHEGFCVPLLEAMLYHIPVLSRIGPESAAEETMGGAGVTYQKPEFPSIAELAARLISDDKLRKAVIKGQNDRMKEYDPEKILASFEDSLIETLRLKR